MILDGNLQLSNQQAVTATADSTNVIDLLNAGDLGAGEDIRVAITTIVAATAAGAATLNIQLVGAANGDSGFGSPQILDETSPIPKANIPIGARFELNVPRIWQGAAALTLVRYLKLTYTVATGPLTAGTFSANVTKINQDNRPYPANFAT